MDRDREGIKHTFRDGSTVTVLPGTIQGVSGPQPPKVYVDEVELMDADVFFGALEEASKDEEEWEEVKLP